MYRKGDAAVSKYTFVRASATSGITATIETSSPQITFTGGENMFFGDRAVGWGTYSTEGTTPDGAVTTSGAYMTTFLKVDGDWKIQGLITNFDADPPEGFAYADPPTEAPEPNTENAPAMGDLISAYQTHYNLGHPTMVADFYLDDAMALACTDDLPKIGRERVVPNLCRMSLEAACMDVVRRRRLQNGDSHASIEKLFDDQPKLLPRLA